MYARHFDLPIRLNEQVQRLEYLTVDARYAAAPSRPPSGNIVLLMLDDASLAAESRAVILDTVQVAARQAQPKVRAPAAEAAGANLGEGLRRDHGGADLRHALRGGHKDEVVAADVADEVAGGAVALSGGTGVVGAYGDRDNGSTSGAVYIYDAAPCPPDVSGDGEAAISGQVYPAYGRFIAYYDTLLPKTTGNTGALAATGGSVATGAAAALGAGALALFALNRPNAWLLTALCLPAAWMRDT